MFVDINTTIRSLDTPPIKLGTLRLAKKKTVYKVFRRSDGHRLRTSPAEYKESKEYLIALYNAHRTSQGYKESRFIE